MDIIKQLRAKARNSLRHIVLPEYEDRRTLEAVKIIESEGIAKVTVLTPDKIDPREKQRYASEFYETYKSKDLDFETAKKYFEDTLYCAAAMTEEGLFDGFVAGASHTTPDVARAAIRCLGIDERITIASGSFIMSVPDCQYGDRGIFIFADCGIIPEPNPRQLACIAVAASELAVKVLDLTPRIAFLSYSTRGSARGRNVDKMIEALNTIKEMASGLLVDGEMQVDTAIVPEVAAIKYPNSPIGGRANILIFPDLEAGNIGYKLVERLAKARALGPLLMGLTKPCSDLSRGCSVEDIVDCVAVTAIRAQ